MKTYTGKEIAVLAYLFGLLTGTILAFSSCSYDDNQVPHTYSHTTQDGM